MPWLDRSHLSSDVHCWYERSADILNRLALSFALSFGCRRSAIAVAAVVDEDLRRIWEKHRLHHFSIAWHRQPSPGHSGKGHKGVVLQLVRPACSEEADVGGCDPFIGIDVDAVNGVVFGKGVGNICFTTAGYYEFMTLIQGTAFAKFCRK